MKKLRAALQAYKDKIERSEITCSWKVRTVRRRKFVHMFDYHRLGILVGYVDRKAFPLIYVPELNECLISSSSTMQISYKEYMTHKLTKEL